MDEPMAMHHGQVAAPMAELKGAIARQFPHLAGCDVRAVASAGTVIAPIRVGDDLVARVPLVPVCSDEDVERLHREADNARQMAAVLPLEIPQLVAVGDPFPGYPGTWSLWTWLDGQSLDRLLLDPRADIDTGPLVRDISQILAAIRNLPTAGGWSATGRGGRPLADSAWVRTSIERSSHLIDVARATAVWERAIDSPPYADLPTRIHGDPMPGNLLIRDGRLSAMIDVAEPSFGDPAADLQPAWTIFSGRDRQAFRDAMGLDDAAWQRGRGWAFEMAIGGLHYYERSNRVFFRLALRTLEELISTAE